MKVTMIGLDIAKRKMYLVGADDKGGILYRKSMRADELAEFLVTQDVCTVVLEACGGSSYWARKIKAMGFTVKLVNPFKVSRVRTKQKNDYNDCAAIIEVAQRRDTKFIGANELWQQDLQSLHRIRSRVVRARVDVTNQIHGLCLEYGIALAEGKAAFAKELNEALEDAENELSPLMRRQIILLRDQIIELEGQQKVLEEELEAIAHENENCQRLMSVPGVGLLSATAFVAAVGDPSAFKNGREVSAWLGLVPKQFTTGGNAKLGGITKKGDKYLRQLLVHGGRSVIVSMKRRQGSDPLTKKILRLTQEQGFKLASVALANRNARVMLAILKNKTEYRTVS